MAVPANGDIAIAYGVPKNPVDLTLGWKSLQAGDEDTVGGKRLADNCAVAFTLLDADGDEDAVEFEVEVPMLEDEVM